MRTFLLLVILVQSAFMAYEFNFFTQHYNMLLKLNEQTLRVCK